MISQNGAIVPADSSSRMSWDGGGGGGGGGKPPSPQFPAGLRVLVVDDDPICLRITEQMLKNCQYEVTTCNRAIGALEILRGKKDGFDLVLSDLHMPDMDGFKLLEHVGLEMDLPVIMMSADDAKDVVMKGVTHGACDYLIKPVRMEAIKNIWQHVIRKKKKEAKENSGSVGDGDKQKLDDDDNTSSVNEGKGRNLKRQKEEREDGDEIEEQEGSSSTKKSRVVWAVDLHKQFVAAVDQLGVDKAVPKKILELMNVPGLTRENVASHLQKYRIYLKRVIVEANPNRVGTHFQGAADPYGYGHQDFANSGQHPLQSIVPLHSGSRRATNIGMDISAAGQQGFFNSEVLHSSKMRPAALQAMNDKQMNMISELSTYMEPRQMGELQGYFNMPSSLRTCSFSSGAVNEHHISLTQQQSGGHLRRTVGDHDFRHQMLSSGIPDHGLGISRTAISVDSSLQGSHMNNSYGKFSPAMHATNYQNNCMNGQVGNSHSLTNSSGTNNITQRGIIQGVTMAPCSLTAVDNAASINGLKNVVPNYDIFSKVHQYQSEGKDFKVQNVNLSFGSAQIVGAKMNNMEFGSSISTQSDGPGSNTCTVTEEVIIRRKIDQHKMGGASQHNKAIQVENSSRLKDCLPEINYQDLYANINDELMDFTSFQQQGIGPDEHEFGL